MKAVKILTGAAVLGALATSAWSADYSVTRTLQLSLYSAEIWRNVGGFCDVDDWHPNVVACELEVIDGKLHRVLSMDDGDRFIDRRIARETGLSYTYKSTETSLPIDKFTSTLSVEPSDGVRVTWSASFSSEDQTMEAKVIELIETGLAGIGDQFGAE